MWWSSAVIHKNIPSLVLMWRMTSPPSLSLQQRSSIWSFTIRILGHIQTSLAPWWFTLMKGLNREIDNILFVGCDRQKSILNGLSRELTIAQFLACTKISKITLSARWALYSSLRKSKNNICLTYLVTGATKDWSTVTVHLTLMQDLCHWEAPGMKEN